MTVRPSIAIRAIVYGVGFVVVWTLVARAMLPLDARIGVTIPGAFRAVGWVIVSAGAALASSCIVAFIAVGEGTPAPFDPPRNFVATGPYRWVRNPMYVGALTTIVGIGVIVGSPAIVLLSLVFFCCAHLFVVFYEEPTLARTFGSSYDQYRSAVSRWIPRRPR